ncbi:D-alanyl-D-alanine carboxypeptidase family protein [Wansuia hejianensis]|uniref:serine-type D-Ala-D-Ala carboxypeptidase n=1 Tax=Wansuia hejianensis TaxID=2763667 RepID=A0A926IMN4_9FIRM|nr:D-alanyl-D-alanine carboxypeptidase family protein [Wansuia hejianensis]MBC8590806.1 D-alanyl-D-alanine carboxypeptidase [Wansuia hejianensis]
MKKIVIYLIIFTTVLNTYSFAANNEPSLTGEGAILVDYDSNRILFDKGSQQKLYPASTTKMMTAILVLEKGNMEDIITIDSEVIDLTDGSHIALDYDEKMSVEQLLNAMMVASANDAALALAKHIGGGSIDNFVKMMNEKAKDIGAINTHYENPNGLHDDNHYTTAYDLYLIAKYAMKNDTFRQLVNKDSYTIEPTNKKTETRNLYSTNKFLYGNRKINLNGKIIPIKYSGVSGIKTGYTPEAGSCLVTFAERNDRKLISVVLKSSTDGVYADTHKLLNYGFNNFINSQIAYPNEYIDNINIKNGNLPFATAILDKSIYYTLKKDDINKIKRKIKINKDISAPISKGDILGVAEFYLDGDLIAKGDIVSTLDVALVSKSKLSFKTIMNKWYLLVLALLIFFRSINLYNRSRRRKRRSKYYTYVE